MHHFRCKTRVLPDGGITYLTNEIKSDTLQDAVTGQAVSFVAELGPLQSISLFKGREGSVGSGQIVLQEGGEPSNDVADKMGQLMERWEQSISPTNRRFDERFLAGEIHVLILFRDTETDEVWFVNLERDSSDNCVFSDRKNETVLVGIVQLAQQPQRLVSAFVRLEPINSLNRFPQRTLYASTLSGFITLRGMKYRELNIRPIFGSSFAKGNSDRDELECQVVQGASEVVNDFSGEDRDVKTVDVKGAGFKDWLTHTGLKIHANHLEGDFTQREGSHFQIIEVLFGPSNFYADQSESVVGVHSPPS